MCLGNKSESKGRSGFHDRMGNDAHSLSLFMVLTGSQPLTLVNTSIVFGMVVMPLTYYPILRAAADTGIMGSHANNPSVTILGIIFLLLITLSAIVAILLMVLTHSGRP